jgi:hypothetical protein
MAVGGAQPANAAGAGAVPLRPNDKTYAGIPKGQPPLWRRSGGSASRAGTDPLDLNFRPAGFGRRLPTVSLRFELSSIVLRNTEASDACGR